MTSLQQSLKQLDEACQSNATPAALDACAAHAEAAIASVPHDIPRSLRRDMKAHLTSLWASFSKLPDTVPSELKARLREVSSRALVAVLGSSPTAPLQAELGRVWLKTSREWLCARNPQRAVTCVDVALSHADTACKGGAAAATLRSDCLLANVEARWRADMDPLQYARSLGDALWQICEDGEKMAQLLFEVAEAAHGEKRMGDCVDTLSLAQECPAALAPRTQARLLRLQTHSYLGLQQPAAALQAVEKSLTLHPTCVGKYLLCKCKLQVGSYAEATAILEALRADPDFSGRMALGLSNALIAAKLTKEAASLLSGVTSHVTEASLRLFGILCESDTDEAYQLLCRVSSLHIRQVETLPDTQLVSFYATAFSKAQHLKGDEAIKWMTKVVDFIPPSRTEDRVRAYLGLAHLHLALDRNADALTSALQALKLAPDCYALYVVAFAHISLDSVGEAQEAMQRLAAQTGDFRSRLLHCLAQHAHTRGYNMLAADAFALLLDETTPYTAEERLQLTLNMVLCCEGDDDVAAKKRVCDGVRSAAVLLESHGVSPDELLWWKCKADENRLYDVSAVLCRQAGDTAGALCSTLRHCSVTLDEGGDATAALQMLEALDCNITASPDLPPPALLNKVRLLLLIKARVRSGATANDVETLLEGLLAVQDITLNDFIAVAAMVAPGSPYHSPGVYTVAMQYVIRLACPHEAGKVAQYAELLRKCMTDAGGRDDQWSVAGKVQEAVATWGSAYPAEELEFMAAEGWNNGIYFHRLECREKAHQWFSVAHIFAQGLPKCRTRDEIETQFDAALDMNINVS